MKLHHRSIFWDKVIEPGQEWGPVLYASLRASDVIVVMWCCDSATSKWVAREIAYARKFRKPLTPIGSVITQCTGPLHRSKPSVWQTK